MWMYCGSATVRLWQIKRQCNTCFDRDAQWKIFPIIRKRRMIPHNWENKRTVLCLCKVLKINSKHIKKGSSSVQEMTSTLVFSHSLVLQYQTMGGSPSLEFIFIKPWSGSELWDVRSLNIFVMCSCIFSRKIFKE